MGVATIRFTGVGVQAEGTFDFVITEVAKEKKGAHALATAVFARNRPGLTTASWSHPSGREDLTRPAPAVFLWSAPPSGCLRADWSLHIPSPTEACGRRAPHAPRLSSGYGYSMWRAVARPTRRRNTG